MKYIQGGTFMMGSLNSLDAGASPPHKVTLHSFSMQETDVTQEQYFEIMGVNPSLDTGNVNGPVELETWFDAVLFCNARSKKDGKDTIYSYSGIIGTPGNLCKNLQGLVIDFNKNGYRLPTEAEWEYACRGGTTTDYYWGNDTSLSVMGEYVWDFRNSGGRTHSVAEKLPNAFGLYDMSGNKWQWCNDWYGIYDSSAQTDPTGADSTFGERVMRGGDWAYTDDNLRSAFRNADYPIPGSRNATFRCVNR